MSIEFRIISIGTLAHNLLWDEPRPVRTPHATTTLVTTGDRKFLVDPSLPANVLAARLFERTGLGAEAITDIFCTTLNPTARRGIEAFPNAAWYAGEVELEWYTRQLAALSESADRLGDEGEDLAAEQQICSRFKPAPEQFTGQVSFYPMAGPTPGCAGLLLTPPTQTVVIAGPAAPTREHIERGMIWPDCADKEAAMETLTDLLELADIIVPGFDNVVYSPRRWM
jgi:hypothetical protein